MDSWRFQYMEKLERQLTKYVDQPAEWTGQEKPFGNKVIYAQNVKERVLVLCVPDGSMSIEQQAAIERIGHTIQQLNRHNTQNRHWKPLSVQVTVVK